MGAISPESFPAIRPYAVRMPPFESESMSAPIREEEVRRAVDLIRTGSDVELVGPWAGGVVDVLADVRRRLERDGFSVFTVNARPGFTGTNFAALRFSLPEVFQGTSEPAVIVDRLARTLWTDGPSLLQLDNADQLDPFSLQAVAEAVRRSQARLMISLSSMTAVPPALHLGRPLLRETLQPSSYLDVEDLLRIRSERPLDPMLVRRIYLDSGGHAQVATALFDAGIRSGNIQALDGVWSLQSSDLWVPGLASLIEQSLSHLSAPARACLRAAALTPTFEGALADEHGVHAVEELVLEGLLHLDDGHPAFVSPPVIVSFFRSRDAGASRSAVPEERMSDRGWTQRLGQQLDASSRAALERARERDDEARSVESATALVRALWSAGASYAEAAEVFARNPAGSSPSLADLRLAILHARWLAFGMSDLSGGLAVLGAVERAGGRYAADAHAHAILISAYSRGIPEDAVAWAQDVAADGSDDYQAVTRVSIANMLMQAGLPLTALEIVGPAIPDDPEAAAVWIFTRVSALLATDDYDTAVALAEHYVSAGVGQLDRERLFAASYGLIQARMYMGQWARARELAENIQVAGRPNLLLLHVQRMAKGVQAVVAAEQGRVSAPDSGLVPGAPQAAPFAVAQPGIQETIERIAAQRYDNIALYLLPAARSADAAGSRFAASYLAAYALSLDPSQAMLESVEGFASNSEMTAFDNFLTYMRPLIEKPEDVIEGRASMVARGTFSYLAIIGTVRRAKSLEGPVHDALMRESYAMSRRLSVVFPKKVAEAAASGTEPLSPRERQIARLAGRLSNAQIAERLGISKRTVDHHVSNALKKTGLASRHDLADRLGAA